MKTLHTNNNNQQKKCLSCYHNITKLKELCAQKGLKTSLNKKYKNCKNHKNDNNIVVHNSFKFDQLSKTLRKTIVQAMLTANKQIQRKKQLRKKRKVNELSHLDSFTVETITVEANEKVKDIIEKPQIDDIISIRSIQSSVLAKANADICREEAASDNTEAWFTIPKIPPIKENRMKYKLPNKEDSLGLLKCTDDFVHSQEHSINKVKYWKRFGHPFVNDLPESQYEIPQFDYHKEDVGWVSPALSPIYPE